MGTGKSDVWMTVELEPSWSLLVLEWEVGREEGWRLE